MRVSLLLASVAAAATLHAARAETLLERGEYLVNAVMGCDGCHTPRLPPGAPAARFAGGSQTWDTPWYTVKGTNITPDPETGIGSWSDDDIRRLMRDGVRPNGVPVAPQMPYAFYKIMTPRDLDAVVAYIKTVPPVRHEVPLPSYKAELAVELVPGAEKPIDEARLADKVQRGFYLATLAHCMECHSKGPDELLNFATGWGKADTP